MSDEQTRLHYNKKHRRFLQHCGLDPDDVWMLQDLEDFINCLKFQSKDKCYILTIKYDALGWTLKATDNCSDKTGLEIVVANCASLIEGIQRLAYRVHRDWGGSLNDNVISFQDYIETERKRLNGEDDICV